MGYVTHTYQKLVKESSDGFIDKSSQIGAKSTNWNPAQVEARGVNHMEMGTHPETERILREAWAGQHYSITGNSSPFYIAPK